MNDGLRTDILCECDRDLTSHVKVEYYDRGVILTYGNLKSVNGFEPIYSECVYFNEAPELRSLVIAGRWQWDDLWALVEKAENANIDTPMRVYLQDVVSGAWRETQVMHSAAG